MTHKRKKRLPSIHIDLVIRTIRRERVILDTDLASVYGIPTFQLNEAVKRNRDRFPEDFLFQLTQEEHAALTSQIAMSKGGRGGRRILPYAFTEHGAVMAANVLNSHRAVEMSPALRDRACIHQDAADNGSKQDIDGKVAGVGEEAHPASRHA